MEYGAAALTDPLTVVLKVGPTTLAAGNKAVVGANNAFPGSAKPENMMPPLVVPPIIA
jgi:hypothetical protein